MEGWRGSTSDRELEIRDCYVCDRQAIVLASGQKLPQMFDTLLKARTQVDELRDEFGAAFGRVMRSGLFIGGTEVAAFEREFGTHIGVDFCIACARYHDGLEMLLRINGIGEDEEVIVPAIGPVGIAHSVSWTGARPRFVDVREEDLTLDPEKLEAAINPHTRAIVALHLYGYPAAMERIIEIADAHDLFLIEDASHAVGSTIGGIPVGNFSHAAVFRFSPGLSLGAYGEAAAVATRDEGIARRVYMLANQGQFGDSEEVFITGTDSRMSEVNAALLRTKLHRQDTWTKKRHSLAELYRTYLSGIDMEIPEVQRGTEPTLASFPVLTPKRELAIRFLNDRGWGAGVALPTLLPTMRCYKSMRHREEEFPVAAKVIRELLPLPLAAEMVRLDVEEICNGVAKALAG